ncbi:MULTISPECIES: hypothetical protein [Amycolatopsis]|uniref:WXG100 family type VII secretion target n=1 Tax=Amycolatopsis albidoflavus TaxID=102226 RepID=A0ABW5HSN0_9PSEU
MSHSTQLSPATINTQASRHDQTADSISGQLDQLKSQVDATLAASPSAATRALSSTCDHWVESVRQSVLKHLHTMAEDIRAEANNQSAVDEQNMHDVLNVPMDTGDFLGI